MLLGESGGGGGQQQTLQQHRCAPAGDTAQQQPARRQIAYPTRRSPSAPQTGDLATGQPSVGHSATAPTAKFSASSASAMPNALLMMLFESQSLCVSVSSVGFGHVFTAVSERRNLAFRPCACA